VTRTWPVAGVLFGILWVFVQGPPLAPEPLVGSLLIGLAVGFPTAFVFRRLYEDNMELRRSLRGVPYVLLYVLTFIREAIVASLDVTYRVLALSSPSEPEVILIPLRVRTDLGVTTIANSITMTPGSLTLNYDPEENALYIHVIDGSDPKDIVDPIRNWENYALIIFDEELSPSDPAPDFAVYPPDRTHPALKQAAPETGRRQRPIRRPRKPQEVTGMTAEGPLLLVIDAAIVLVALLNLLCGYRAVRGPTVPDRVVALDAIATNVVAIAVLFAIKTGRGLFVIVSLVLAIIAFLSTVAVAKFITEGDIIVTQE